MTMYGLNFGAATIPDKLRRVFRRSIRVHDCQPGSACRAHPKRRGCGWAYLAGCTDSALQLRVMLITADNGVRTLHIRVRIVSGVAWYAVYTS